MVVAGFEPAVAGVIRPGNLELVHVRAVDLIERRVMRPRWIASVNAPLSGGIGRLLLIGS